MEEIKGVVENIVFTSEATGFTVAKIRVEKEHDLTCIVGEISSIRPGETVELKGTWKNHAQFGRQFDVKEVKATAPEDLFGIQKYLESGLIKGIGPVYAKKIVKYFGLKTLDIIDNSPNKLCDVPGIGKKRVEEIKLCWGEQRAIREVMIFLQSHHMRVSFAQKIFKVYGEKSLEKIKDNPYALAKNVFGIGFLSADELAKNLGLAHDSPARVQAGIEFSLWELSTDGHVCCPEKTLIQKSAKLLAIDEEVTKQGIEPLEREGIIIKSHVEDVPTIWIKSHYLAERNIAREIQRILEGDCSLREINSVKGLEWIEEKMKLKLAKEQKEAILKSLTGKLHIITGGPGTGKSTITKAIITITAMIAKSIVLAAPTGRAAKRMTEITYKKASTIHSLLEFDFTTGGFKRNKKNPLECDLIIVDECSMIDTHLMLHLLKAIPDNARVILIGDIDQLPSVGPGNVLRDMIDSEKIEVSMLKKIFRQAQGSKIVTNAHRINSGYFPDVENTKNSDFLYFESNDQEDILQKVIELVHTRIPDHFDYNPIKDIQVLSPMKRGIVGTENINRKLQSILNPEKHSIVKMGREFKTQDKVMQIRNNYNKHVYNGDVGTIQSIDTEDQEVAVDFDGKEVYYDFTELDELMLAYAVSIHKYQGSECPVIVIPIHTSHFKLLFRNLLYTGVTRGKKLVVVVGSKKALTLAINNEEVKKRFTGLKQIIAETLTSKLFI